MFDNTQPSPPAGGPDQTSPSYAGAPVPGKVPLRKRRWFLPTAVGVGAFVFGTVAAGAGSSSPTTSEVKSSSEYQALATDLERAKNEASSAQAAADDAKEAQDKAEAKVAELEAAAPSTPAKEPSAPTSPAAAPAAATFAMPDVVGTNLQLAQDRLQALGSYVMDQQDAAGLGRVQVIDSNWKVCTQDPAPGAVVPTSTVVTLAAVKLAETCP